MAEVLVQFKSVGDEDTLQAVRKVTKNVNDLKRIAKTPIDLKITKDSMATDEFAKVKRSVLSAKDATKDWAKETEKLWQQQQKLATAAERAAKAGRSATMAGITGASGGGQGKSPVGLFGPGPMAGPDPRAFSTKAVDDLNKSLDKTPEKAKKAAEGLGFVGRIIAAMAVRSFVREIYEMANAWTAFQNKIKTVLKDQEDLGYVTKELVSIAQRSRSSLEAVGTVYTRTSRAVEQLGKSQYETMKFTETLTKAVAVGGATSVEAKNAMIQLSQGMSSGTLRGDELRSVLEQLPIVAELIAKKMNVTVGQLRKLGAEGKLTTDVVFGAIVEATDDINKAFDKMKPTMEQIVGVIKDKFMIAIGESSKLMDLATGALQLLSENFDTAFKAAEAFTAVMLALGTGKIVTMLASFATALGPIGIAITGITVAASALYVFGDKMYLNAEKTRTFNDAIKSLWEGTKEAVSKSTQGFGEIFDLMGKGFGVMGTALTDFSDKITEGAVRIDDFHGKLKMNAPADAFINNLERTEQQADKTATALTKLANAYENYAAKNPTAIIGEGVYTERDPREAALELGRARDAAARKFQEENAIRTKKFNDFLKGNMPPELNQYLDPMLDKPKPGKGSKEHGKNLEEVIKEATFTEGTSRMGDIEEKVKERIHKIVNSLKPSIKAAIEDIGGTKAMEAEMKRLAKIYDTNYDKFTSRGIVEEQVDKKVKERIAAVKAEGDAIRNKAKILEELVRVEIEREEREKSMLEREKLTKKAVEEGIKKAKELVELRKKLMEETADRQMARSDSLKSTASAISPDYAIVQQIEEMRKFQDFAKQNHMADWAQLAQEKIESLHRALKMGMDPVQNYKDQMASIFGPGGTLVTGFADAAANAIIMSQSLGDLRRALVDVLNTVQKQALSSLIQLPLNIAMGALTKSLTGGPTTFSPGSGGGHSVDAATAKSWNIIDPSAGKGFASGGYTGNMGVNTPAGIVHGQEYVLNADATRRMGRQNLDMINKGGTPVTTSSQPVINIHNNAGVQVEAHSVSPGQVEVMITKAIQAQTGRYVASQINDPNSIVSRSIQKNIDTGRRRT